MGKRQLLRLSLLASALMMSLSVQLRAQSGPEFRRSGIMDGNLVKSVYGNWGVIGQPAVRGNRGAWLHPNNGYIGDVSVMVGAEVTFGETMFHSVVVCPVDRPTSGGYEESPVSNKRWGFEPVPGYFNDAQQEVAISNNPNSWPSFWPDRLDDALSPGWRGSWNGYFGRDQFNADLETYFVMDDQSDEEFNFANFNRFGIDFKSDATNPTRNGLGLEVKVRALQWNDVLAQDCIFWLYEVTNQSTTNYNRVVFAELVGTYVGTTSTNDSPQEYDDDFSFFDVERDLTYTADFDDNVASRNPLWVGEVGVVGYAFLESPGNPFDGIDNDGDADDYLDAGVPATAPLFEASDFDSLLIAAGRKIVLTSNDGQFTRTVVSVPNDTITFVSQGQRIFVNPGVTKLIEGNSYRPPGQQKEIVNPNAYDGLDNDLDGLIDENSQLHYRQVRRDQLGNVLFDQLKPVNHKDYFANLGLRDPMLDEARDDGLDNDNDWDAEFDDVGLDGKAGTGDFGEGDGTPTSGRGTDLPGERNIDKPDVDESDQIGLTSFEYFAPSKEITLKDDENLWQRLTPGFFDVPPSIVNNVPTQGEDGDFIFSSGYFPLPAGQTRSFSLALVYGAGGGPQLDLNDLLKNLGTVQKIYNSNYQFPQAPLKPTVKAFADNGKVTLYWDSVAEESIDPVTRVKDFEGYKIYRATDPEFNDARVITNSDGTLEQLKPIAQFDLNNDVSGYFQAQGVLYQDLRGLSFLLGNNTGLQHSYVDVNVDNGRTYYYAVVAYDRGDATADIFPKENTRVIRRLESNELITDINTVIITPQAKVAGYAHPEGSVPLTPIVKIATGDVNYQVLDEHAITGHTYQLEFHDSSNDGIDNNNNWNAETDDVGSDGLPGTNDADGTEANGTPEVGEPNIDHRDAQELFEKFATSYSVKDVTGIDEVIFPEDTLFVDLSHQNVISGSVQLHGPGGEVVPVQNYVVRSADGKLKAAQSGLLQPGQHAITYQYYPVFRSKSLNAIQRPIPGSSETGLSDTDNFDGLNLSFRAETQIARIESKSGFNREVQPFFFSFAPIDLELDGLPIKGFRNPADYLIVFANNVVDTSATFLGALPYPVNFRVFNVTDNRYIDFLLIDLDGDGTTISSSEEIAFVEPGVEGAPTVTWDMLFSSRKDTTVRFEAGDTLRITTTKPFRRGDLFEFSPQRPAVNRERASAELSQIRVVPNPYVAASIHEPPLPAGVTSGIERRITFTHIPAGAKIHVFTARGELVRTLTHDADIQDGSVNWNLKSHENLDIAPGVYFYVVDSEVGQKTGKIAIIK